MIADSLAHADRYVALHPLFRRGFEYLRRFTPETPDGRYEIEGDRLFALVQTLTTTPTAEKRFEAHRRYIDIQYLHAGDEVLFHAPAERLGDVVDPYNPEKDIGFYRDPAVVSPTRLCGGEFVIYFPHDAHKPACTLGPPATVRKVILKVAVQA